MGPHIKKPGWTWISALFLVLLLTDLCAITWYLRAIPESQFDNWKKTVSILGSWVGSVLGFFGIKYATKVSLSKALTLLPVRLSTIVVTLIIWFFIVPFHSITLNVLGQDGKPLEGVSATLDGVRKLNPSDERGQLTIAGLAAWNHKIVLEKAGYKPMPESNIGFADVLSFRKWPPQKLEEADGTVVIHSIPPGAAVYIDGSSETIGSAESFSLRKGKHKVTLQMPGYDALTKEIEVRAGEKLELPNGRLHAKAERTYPLLVDSEPTEAEIYVDGKFRGTTRETIWLPKGQHTIELRKASYRSARGTVSIPNQTVYAPEEPLRMVGAKDAQNQD